MADRCWGKPALSIDIQKHEGNTRFGPGDLDAARAIIREEHERQRIAKQSGSVIETTSVAVPDAPAQLVFEPEPVREDVAGNRRYNPEELERARRAALDEAEDT